MTTHVRFRLYLGRNTPGQTVSAEDLNEFYKTVVLKYFDGFSVQRGQGFWKRDREDMVTLEILVDSGASGLSEAAVLTVARIYKERFSQEAVLVTREDVEAKFV